MKTLMERMKNISKRTWIIIGVVFLVIILIAFKRNNDNGVTTMVVERQDVVDSIELAGNVDVQKRVDLGFASSGRVAEVLVEEGQEVREGQTIARIDQNQLQASLIEAQANRVVTEADTLSDVDSAVTDLETIEQQQDALVEGKYDEYLSGDLQAYLAEESSKNLVAPVVTGTYLDEEEGEYEIEVYRSGSSSGFSFRISGLESGTYSAEIYQPGKLGERGLYILFDEDSQYANTTWVVPVPNKRSVTYSTRKAAYENALANREQVLASAENQLERLGRTSSNISRSEAQVQRAQAQVNAVYAQLKDGRIVAPFDGVVARNDLEIGEIVSAFDPLVTIFGSNERELKLNVPEIYINKIETSDQVDITLDAYPDELFTGSVQSIDIIDTIVDGVPVYETVVIFDNQDPRIRVGMNAKAKVVSDSRTDVVAIPQHYLVEEEGDYYVLLKDSDNQVKTPVEVGFMGNDGLVEILSGISETAVIVRPQTVEQDA